MARSMLNSARPVDAVARPFGLGAAALAAVVALVAIVLLLSVALGRVGARSVAPAPPTVAPTSAAAQPSTGSYLDTAVHERDYCQCQK